MSKNCPVVHFEMPYEDAKRMSAFYERAFGWTMQSFGEDMGNYVLAHTTATANGRPTTPGAINGGFFPKGAGGSTQPSVVVAVDDINVGVKDVTSAGGKVLGEPIEIPGVGIYVGFTDPEGNRLSLLQPKGM